MALIYVDKLINSDYYQQEAEIFTGFADAVDNALDLVKVSRDNISTTTNDILDYRFDIKTLVFSQEKLYNAINNIFGNFNLIGETPVDTFNFLFGLSKLVFNARDFSGGNISPIETICRDQLIVNVKHFQQYIAGSVLTSMLVISLTIKTRKASDIAEIIRKLSIQYDFVKNNNIFEKIDRQTVTFVEDLNPLINIFTQTLNSLKKSQVSLPFYQEKHYSRTSLLKLAYQQYGNFDNINDLVEANPNIDPLNITGNFTLLTND